MLNCGIRVHAVEVIVSDQGVHYGLLYEMLGRQK